MYEIPLIQLLNQKKINQRTYDKVIIGKQYIERKYNLKAIKNVEWNEILSKINSLNIPEQEKKLIKDNIYNQETKKYRKARIKQSIRDYESLKIIGRGAFGEVHVCRNKNTEEIVAIKKIKKEALYNKNQIIHIKNEQLFMSKVKSSWIVELKASFQDFDYLYLVMEFLQGGDLMNILIKKDILSEEEARFYIAEIILAIESIHKLDCIHRDIKPDNVLIDKSGHIKLTDFGLAKISDKILQNNFDKNININNNNIETEKPTHNKNYSCVGTAYYVAPEVLNKKGYGPEIDWWSVGVIFYEMLVGYVPFCSKDTSEACYKVVNWKKFLKIPPHIRISSEAEDLILKMINSPQNRLGKNGAQEIKSHPFFYGFNWDNIQNIKPPFIPFLRNEYDTSYFETYEKIEPFYPPLNTKFKRKNVEYLDYSFRNDSLNDITLNDEYENAIKYLHEIKEDSKKNNSYEINKNIKKRSNGRQTLGILNMFSKSQNETNDISNIANHSSFKPSPCLKTISNNSSKTQLNKIVYLNSCNNSINKMKLSNCPSSRNSKTKVNIIKIGQKKYKKVNDSLNRIKIPKGFNKSVNSNTNTNKKNKRAISPIFKNIYLNKNKNNTYKTISLNKINNKIMNSIYHYRSYCINNKNNKKLNFNYSYIIVTKNKNNKNRVFLSYRNDKIMNGDLKPNKLNKLNTNTYSSNILYTNYIKAQKNLNTISDKSPNIMNNKMKLANLNNNSLRLSPINKNSEFLKKLFFNRKNIPSNNKKIISHNGMKSPILFLNSSKTIYTKEIKNISKYKKNNTVNKNSFKAKNILFNIGKQSKNGNIYNKN